MPAAPPYLGGVRLGVLDIGSNTVHLLVVDAHRGGHPNPMSSTKSVLRLAERIDGDGRLADDAAGTSWRQSTSSPGSLIPRGVNR